MWTDDGAQLSPLNASQESFDRTVAYAGGCVTHWFEDTGGGTGAVRSARLDVSGAFVWAGSPITGSSRSTGKSRLDVALDSCGMSSLVWADGGGGTQDILVQNVRSQGVLGPLPVVLGDMNCDLAVTVDDIPLFAIALTDPAAYAAANPCCPIARANTNGDHQINGLDCQTFVNGLLGP